MDRLLQRSMRLATASAVDHDESVACVSMKKALHELIVETRAAARPSRVRGPELKLDAHVRKMSRVTAISRSKGDVYVKELLRYLDSFGMDRTASQREFHTAFLSATLPHIYGSAEFERNRTRILREHNLQKPRHEVLVVTPRRWGKTTSVAMFVAALVLSTADMWVSIFSTGQRASSSLLEAIYKMVCATPNGSQRVLRRNQEQLYLNGDGPDDTRRVYSYPSSVQGVPPTLMRITTSAYTVSAPALRSIVCRRLSS
ncbi:hypothetical protein CYMTET_2595 [Cymbomonas tetramitiformis]|uniref:Uncharacterized protein n=2 Tax=Cymbomonas tetramitiformis TaxID=36881 RepID=A0AAE0H1Y4_9CHLO|nr:hypothetical protein CYMTET_4029 [Cymbomonas tetramitiformis]KAK3289836.1 hypothetical protein CYMTET_2767 [Cymbomonas tetramitiformis]KAK3289992.1 hypothetical protein CYMTET_2595 [Cymbomonas tetramitiformis]